MWLLRSKRTIARNIRAVECCDGAIKLMGNIYFICNMIVETNIAHRKIKNHTRIFFNGAQNCEIKKGFSRKQSEPEVSQCKWRLSDFGKQMRNFKLCLPNFFCFFFFLTTFSSDLIMHHYAYMTLRARSGKYNNWNQALCQYVYCQNESFFTSNWLNVFALLKSKMCEMKI